MLRQVIATNESMQPAFCASYKFTTDHICSESCTLPRCLTTLIRAEEAGLKSASDRRLNGCGSKTVALDVAPLSIPITCS
jgi:hypothetical protein